jgi:hypothetical protein
MYPALAAESRLLRAGFSSGGGAESSSPRSPLHEDFLFIRIKLHDRSAVPTENSIRQTADNPASAAEKPPTGHDRPASKTVRETEAEAVAFIVTTAVGIRPSVDATDYIQLYNGNADTLLQSLHRIQATAKTILSALPLDAPAGAARETASGVS